jgi:hypothetical protein
MTPQAPNPHQNRSGAPVRNNTPVHPVDVSIAENWDNMLVFALSAIYRHLRKVTEANRTICMVG